MSTQRQRLTAILLLWHSSKANYITGYPARQKRQHIIRVIYSQLQQKKIFKATGAGVEYKQKVCHLCTYGEDAGI